MASGPTSEGPPPLDTVSVSREGGMKARGISMRLERSLVWLPPAASRCSDRRLVRYSKHPPCNTPSMSVWVSRRQPLPTAAPPEWRRLQLHRVVREQRCGAALEVAGNHATCVRIKLVVNYSSNERLVRSRHASRSQPSPLQTRRRSYKAKDEHPRMQMKSWFGTPSHAAGQDASASASGCAALARTTRDLGLS